MKYLDTHGLYYYRQLLRRYDDVGSLSIPETCPSQVNETGHHKFRARAFWDNYPQDTIWNYIQSQVNGAQAGYMAQLEAIVAFGNGSSWTGTFDINLLHGYERSALLMDWVSVGHIDFFQSKTCYVCLLSNVQVTADKMHFSLKKRRMRRSRREKNNNTN